MMYPLSGFGGSASFTNPAPQVTHSNTWLAPVGQVAGTVLGSVFAPEFGGTFWGGPAGKMLGTYLGDAVAGNQAGMVQDQQQMNAPFQMLGMGSPMGGGMPGMGGGLLGGGMPMGGGLLGGMGPMAGGPINMLSGLGR